MPIKVTNGTDQMLNMHSFDGDSVSIPPKAREVQVKNKYNWQVPKGLFIVAELGPDDTDVVAEPVAVEAPAAVAVEDVVEEPKSGKQNRN